MPVKVIVNAGSHKLHSNDKSTGIELDAKPWLTYSVRVDIKAGGWKGHGQVTLIDPQEGKYEFSQQKLSASRDLTSNPAAGGEPAKAPDRQQPRLLIRLHRPASRASFRRRAMIQAKRPRGIAPGDFAVAGFKESVLPCGKTRESGRLGSGQVRTRARTALD